MARPKYINLYLDYLEAIEPFSDAERGRLFTALLVYGKTGVVPELGGNERFIFPTIRTQIDRDFEAYEEKCKSNSKNGKCGGRPKKPNGFEENQTVLNKSEKSQEEGEEEGEEEEEKNKNIFVETGVSTPPKKSKKIFGQDSIEYKSAKYLADKILEKSPNARVPREYKDLLKWCVHIDYILRLDNRPIEEFRKVLAFAVNDSFWSTTILSTKKLREKYDQLFMQMTREKEYTNGGNSKQSGIGALESTHGEDNLSGIDKKLVGKWADV